MIIPWRNVALGTAMCAVLAWQAITYGKIKCPTVFGLALCLLGACAFCGVALAEPLPMPIPGY